MPSFLHQPGYQDFPLQLPQGVWLHSSRWEATDFDFFTTQRLQHQKQILSVPRLYRHKRRVSPSVDACWVLRAEHCPNPIGWGELQCFPGKRFGRGFLFYGIHGAAEDAALELLAGLVSLVFTISRLDYMTILSSDGDAALVDQLSQLTGSLHTLASLPVKAWRPDAGGLQFLTSLAVDRNSWRSCTALQTSQRQLRHIEMRFERIERMDHGKQKTKRKRHFLARLFKPKIDDSLL